MIRVALCDDEEQQLIHTESLLREYDDTHPEVGLRITSFRSGANLLEHIRTHDTFDLYLLDIIMPRENGIETGCRIREIDKGGIIFYVTSSTDYAIDAFSAKASQYLLKPIDKYKLFEALDTFAEDWRIEQQSFIVIKTHEGMQRIALRSIVWGELVGHCIHYHLADGTEIEGMSLRISFKDAVAPLLKDSRFILTSASFVVNLSFVETINDSGIRLTNGSVLPMSRTLKAGIRNKWFDYHLRDE